MTLILRVTVHDSIFFVEFKHFKHRIKVDRFVSLIKLFSLEFCL